MASESYNHTAQGSLQEPPSPCPSFSPFCPFRKKKPQGEPAETVQAVRCLPHRTPRIHLDPIDQQKANTFQAQRLWEKAAGRRWIQGGEWITVRRLGATKNSSSLWLRLMWELPSHSSCQTGLLQMPPFLLSLAGISTERFFITFSIIPVYTINKANDEWSRKYNRKERRKPFSTLNGFWPSSADSSGVEPQPWESSPQLSHTFYTPLFSSLCHPQLAKASGIGYSLP